MTLLSYSSPSLLSSRSHRRRRWQGISSKYISMNQYYYIYIVTNCRHTVFYTGITNNLARRIWEHRNKIGKASSFTKRYNIDKLIYYELYYDVNDAIAAEKMIKKYSRTKKFKLINKLNPKWQDLYDEIFG